MTKLRIITRLPRLNLVDSKLLGLIFVQYYDLKPSQLTDEIKIDHLVKVLALVQTSDKKSDPGPGLESSERTQTDETENSPVLRKVEDEELTVVSTLKRRQSDQEVRISHEQIGDLDCLLYEIINVHVFRLRAY